MYFDKDLNANPKKSSTVELDPDGSYTKYYRREKCRQTDCILIKMATCIVCDMMGHRVVEMTTKGEVVKVLQTSTMESQSMVRTTW